MVIDVKSKHDGEYFYSFAIKKGAAPQTLLAAVTGQKPETTPELSIPHPDPAVKNQFSFSSPKTDTDDAQKILSDHALTVKPAELTKKTALQKVKDEFGLTKPPSADEAPTANQDVANLVNTEGLKRADDIELQYSQRLKGKNAMLFKDLPRVLDYVCDKMPGVRDFWRRGKTKGRFYCLVLQIHFTQMQHITEACMISFLLRIISARGDESGIYMDGDGKTAGV